jgi:hypothetical protein
MATEKSFRGVADTVSADDYNELSDEILPEDGRDFCDRVVRKAVRMARITFMSDSLGQYVGFFVQVLVSNET